MIYVRVQGWKSPFAKLKSLSLTPGESLPLDDGTKLVWNKIEIPELRWEHIGMMRILEGVPLQHFFSSCVLESNTQGGYYVSPRAWILLKAKHGRIYDPVPKMTDVVLAEVLPRYVNETSLYGSLLSRI